MAILDVILGQGHADQRREWGSLQKRVKALPEGYQVAYKAIQKYSYNTGLVGNDWQRFIELLELFEVATLDGNKVQEIVGSDVAEFCDVFFDKREGHGSWLDKRRQALNEYFANKG